MRSSGFSATQVTLTCFGVPASFWALVSSGGRLCCAETGASPWQAVMHNAMTMHPHHTSQCRRVVGSQDHRASHTVSLTDCTDTGGSPPPALRYLRSALYPYFKYDSLHSRSSTIFRRCLAHPSVLGRGLWRVWEASMHIVYRNAMWFIHRFFLLEPLLLVFYHL